MLPQGRCSMPAHDTVDWAEATGFPATVSRAGSVNDLGQRFEVGAVGSLRGYLRERAQGATDLFLLEAECRGPQCRGAGHRSRAKLEPRTGQFPGRLAASHPFS